MNVDDAAEDAGFAADQDGADDAPLEPGMPRRRSEDGSFDGGVALTASSGKKSISDCDLLLYIECQESIPAFPDHPLLTAGVTVAIGLDKTTRLNAVFGRYIELCNEVPHSSNEKVVLKDLEFFHVTLLDDGDTPEAAALMKNDKVRVRAQRRNERTEARVQRQLEKELDQKYFATLRNLLPDLNSYGCDVILDCRGKLVDAAGLNQETLRTGVRGHSSILSKRCKWLGRAIQASRDELERRSVVSIPDHEGERMQQDDDEEDNIEVLNYAPAPREPVARAPAAQIENDEEETVSMAGTSRSGSPIMSTTSGSNSMLWVTIPDHSPDAVKLLLEYCYTNRVLSLGKEAFLEASKPKPSEEGGPIMPQQWPQFDRPSVSFELALAGISLAEVADLPRLSLMCEIAAVQKLSQSHVVEALAMCTSQHKSTCNPLKKLQAAAMTLMLKRGPRGVGEITRTMSFRRALDEKSSLLLPALMSGTMDMMQKEGTNKGGGLDAGGASHQEWKFEQLDLDDRRHREEERRKHRVVQWDNDETTISPHEQTEWNTTPVRKKMRRSTEPKTMRATSRSRRRSREGFSYNLR